MKNIIICVDFSSNTEIGLNKGVDLAKAFDAQLILLHVTHPSIQVGQPETTEKSVRNSVAEEFKEEHEQLHQLSERAREQGINARALLLNGAPADEIVRKEAEELRADLIIVCTKGHSRIGGFCLGSFSQRLLKQVTHPVLVVPGE